MSAAVVGILSFASAALAIGLWMRFMNDVTLGGRRAPLFALSALGVALGVFAFTRDPGPGWVGGSFATVGTLLGGVWLFLGALAAQSKQEPVAGVGEALPNFTALDHAGEPFELSSLRGHPVLIKLFRGHW